MSEQFFELSSPRDMLEKSKRDLLNLKANVNTDNIFNFFVTVFHVGDYVEEQFPNTIGAFKKLKGVEAYKKCAFICNKGKHLKVNKNRPDGPTANILTGGWDKGVWDKSVWDDDTVICYVDGHEIDILSLAERMIELWEDFFSKNGI